MMRLTPLSLAANTIFYLILAVMYCRVLTRRFSWPFTLLGLTVGYLLYIIPTKFMPYADAERMLFGLVTFPLTPIVLFRDKWYKSLLCAFAGLVAMAASDLLSVSWLLTPERSVFLSRPAWTAASCASRSATRPRPRPHGTAAASRSWNAASARTSSARWRRPMRAATRSRRPEANARPAFF